MQMRNLLTMLLRLLLVVMVLVDGGILHRANGGMGGQKLLVTLGFVTPKGCHMALMHVPRPSSIYKPRFLLRIEHRGVGGEICSLQQHLSYKLHLELVVSYWCLMAHLFWKSDRMCDHEVPCHVGARVGTAICHKIHHGWSGSFQKIGKANSNRRWWSWGWSWEGSFCWKWPPSCPRRGRFCSECEFVQRYVFSRSVMRSSVLTLSSRRWSSRD